MAAQIIAKIKAVTAGYVLLLRSDLWRCWPQPIGYLPLDECAAVITGYLPTAHVAAGRYGKARELIRTCPSDRKPAALHDTDSAYGRRGTQFGHFSYRRHLGSGTAGTHCDHGNRPKRFERCAERRARRPARLPAWAIFLLRFISASSRTATPKRSGSRPPALADMAMRNMQTATLPHGPVKLAAPAIADKLPG